MIGGTRIGLDLGRAGVKGVRCTRAGTMAAEVRVDPDLRGDERHAALVEAVVKVADELGARKGQELHLAVPRAETIVKRLTLPDVGPDELEQMIRFQAAKVLPFDLSEMVLTWTRLNGDGGSVVFAAARRQALEAIRKVVLDAGFVPGSLEISTQAAARTLCLRTVAGKADSGEVLLIEVGKANSDVIVMEGGRLVFSRSASVGCGAEGVPGPWIQRLVAEVVRSVVAARTDDLEDATVSDIERTGSPGAVFLGGGGACLDELHAALALKLGSQPTVLSGLDEGDLTRGARFVVARGLADPREVSGVPKLDLARHAEARAARVRKQRMVLGLVAACAVLICLSLLANATLSSREEHLADLRTQKERLKPAVEKAREVQRELDLVRGWDARKGRELEVLLAVSSSLPEGERVYLTQVRWVEQRPLRIVGRAKDWDAVGDFLSNLEKHPLIDRATFDSISDPKKKGVRGVEFSGQAVLVPARGAR